MRLINYTLAAINIQSVLIETRIKAAAPLISDTVLEHALRFAMNAMRQTRDIYHEPVALLDVILIGQQELRFTVRALITHNTSDYHFRYTPEITG